MRDKNKKPAQSVDTASAVPTVSTSSTPASSMASSDRKRKILFAQPHDAPSSKKLSLAEQGHQRLFSPHLPSSTSSLSKQSPGSSAVFPPLKRTAPMSSSSTSSAAPHWLHSPTHRKGKPASALTSAEWKRISLDHDVVCIEQSRKNKKDNNQVDKSNPVLKCSKHSMKSCLLTTFNAVSFIGGVLVVAGYCMSGMKLDGKQTEVDRKFKVDNAANLLRVSNGSITQAVYDSWRGWALKKTRYPKLSTARNPAQLSEALEQYHDAGAKAKLAKTEEERRHILMNGSTIQKRNILEAEELQNQRMNETQAFIDSGLAIPPNWSSPELSAKVSEIMASKPLKLLVLNKQSSFYIFQGLQDLSDKEAFAFVSRRARYITSSGEVQNSRPALTHLDDSTITVTQMKAAGFKFKILHCAGNGLNSVRLKKALHVECMDVLGLKFGHHLMRKRGGGQVNDNFKMLAFVVGVTYCERGFGSFKLNV